MHTITNKLRERVLELKRREVPAENIRVMLKEVLQDYVLAGIYSSHNYRDLVFIGGTALRKLHNLDRYSEDLDYDTENPVDYEDLGKTLVAYFKSLEFDALDYSIQQAENVSRLTLKFRILKEIGLSNLENEKLHIKVETTIGKIYETELFTRTIANTPIVIKSYPLSTLMAGKILACLYRTFEKGNTGIKIKGRDFYDLIWYMSRGIKPNEEVLRDSNTDYSIENIFKMLDEKVAKISKRDLIADLVTFFEDLKAIEVWCDSFKQLYLNYRKNYS